ncbi:adenylate/guanylate cyclase domain-containing protein [uncultured Dokdonia sp.]|uniref:adenylate/guanylate cyclase domain-containing protein n=1 Tax=uncultured Dokdonia sp. TaxID=575653 RepID=UPI0026226BC6|nr:adenylate/guanylate cyclase domain-containing protein [uncultured Dokdonia sp.]
MKKQFALIFLRHKQSKGKYLHIALLLFFSLCYFFALSENKSVRTKVILQEPQKQPVPSLKKTADSLFNQINLHIQKGAFAKAELVAQSSLQMYRSLDEIPGIGNCLNKIATISYYIADYPRALTYYDQSIDAYECIDFQKGVASSVNNKGAIYYHLGNYPEALAHYKKAVIINETLGAIKQKASALQNIGGIYLELEEYTQAMNYLKIAKKTYESLDNKKTLSQVNNGIGGIYLKQEKYKKALAFVNKGLQLAKTIEDKQRILESTYILGAIKEATHQTTEALHHYKNTLQLANQLDNKRYKSLSLIALGEVYYQLDDLKMGRSHCKQGLKISEELNIISAQEEGCACLYQINKSLGNTKTALLYYEQSVGLSDSLQTRKTANQMLHMEFEKEQLLDSIYHSEKERRVKERHKVAIEKKERQRNLLIISACFIIVIAGTLWSRLKFTKKSKAKLQLEKDRSEHLLLNILPEEIAEELKTKGYVDAQDFETASILFTDFKSFTETASKLSPQELVEEINVCFKAFDAIMETYHIEKIKTIGDAYMAAGGLPKPDAHAVKNTILAALEMQSFIRKRKKENTLAHKPAFDMRVGIHVGPIVAGIVGVKKFQYDIWGDTVNTASRMESNGEAGKVNISQDTYNVVQNEADLVFEYRGKIDAKGKGALAMYFVSKKNT